MWEILLKQWARGYGWKVWRVFYSSSANSFKWNLPPPGVSNWSISVILLTVSVLLESVCASLHAKSLSYIWLFATVGTVAHQASLSRGFSRQEYWSGLPFPPSGDLPDPGIKPVSFVSPALASGFFSTSTTWDCSLALLQKPDSPSSRTKTI